MVLGANLHPLTSTPAQGWPHRWLHGLRSWLRPRPAAPRALPAPTPAPAPDPLARTRQEAHDAEAEGRWDGAIRAWGTIVANVSGDVPARLRLAEAFMAAEQPARGLATLREALALVRRQDRPDELLAIARHVLHHDRKDRSLTVEVVRLLVRRGEADEAALVLDRHFAACPPDATLLLTLERGAKGGVSALILERAARAALARSDDVRVTAVSARVLGLPAPTRAALEEPTGRISNDALAGLLRASQPAPGLEAGGADEHAMDELLASITPDPAGICTRKVDAIVVDLVVAESRVDNARA
jgi:hypothetical protein